MKPATEKVAPAVAQIAGQFPRDDVTLYLNTLLCQDPDTWKDVATPLAGLEAGS